ncbi:hypothetical protein [Streptomyces sp. NPDC003717]|uniref:hypothetical protein n=1 Tax=Streptomyces sp. NPDC003717 TaxID=3154276 RepID=UPI0033BA47AB
MPPTSTPLPAGPRADQRDAVRVPRQLGLAALSILGARAGAVVEDPTTLSVYLFIPAGTAASWRTENTEALAGAESAPVPPRRRTEGPGPHWRVCPGDDGRVTDPATLEAALAEARIGFPLPDPQPVAGCPQCVDLDRLRARARRAGDLSLAVDCNVQLRTHRHATPTAR